MWSVMQVKGLNDGERTISGIATTPSTDRMGDIVESKGAKYKLPLPLLWQHRHDSPVGHVTFAQPNEKGIPFQARIAKIDEPGELKDLTDKAWQAVKARLVQGVSIGFTPIEYDFIKGGGVHFKSWDWHELSLVTIPAQSEANITVIRSLDTAALNAATGNKQRERVLEPAGVSARATARQPEARVAVKTIAEDIAAYSQTLTAHVARMKELMAKASEDGSTLDPEQETEYDELEGKIEATKKHLDRLKKQEKLNIEAAVVVDGETVGKNASVGLQDRPRVPASVQVKRPAVEKGTAFVRFTIAQAMAKGNVSQAAHIARRDAWRDTPEVAEVLNFVSNQGSNEVLKAAITPATTYDSTWSGPLYQYQYMTSEFVSLLRSATILDKIQGFRNVPFNIRVPTQSAGSTAYWVGEGSMKPLSSAAFSTFTMSFAKVAALVPFTQESLRFDNPSLETLMRQDMIAAIAKKLDTDLLDPTKAAGTGSGGASPASLTNGVSSIVATGTDATAAMRDARTLLNTIASLDIDMSTGVWVMHPTQAISLSLMLNALGQPEFPSMRPGGGTFVGFPVITSTNIPSSGGSPTDGYMMAFIVPSEILLADDGNVTIDASDQASLQFDSAPDSPVSASTVTVSLWQANLIALRAERYINWYKRRSGCVQYLDFVKYSP